MRSAEIRGAVCLAGAAACAAAGLLGGQWAAGFLPGDRKTVLLPLYLINAVQQIFVFALPAMLLMAMRPGGLTAFGRQLRIPSLLTVSRCALLAAGGTAAVSVLAELWAQMLRAAFGYSGSALPLPSAGTTGEWLLALLSTAAVPALCEELFFRSLLQERLLCRWPRAGIWIGAVLFAGVHGRWDAFPALAAVGAVLGIVCRYRGYIASVLLHAMYNGLVLFLSSRNTALSLLLVIACFAACTFSLRGLTRPEEEPHGADSFQA